MKRTWNVSADITGCQSVGTYEAETGEQAIEMASEDVSTSFCHHCARRIENAEIVAMHAESGGDMVSQHESNWEDAARKAGWRPPAKKRAQKRRGPSDARRQPVGDVGVVATEELVAALAGEGGLDLA